MMWKKRGSYENLDEYYLGNLGVASYDDINNWFVKHYAHNYRIDRLDEAVELAKKYKDKAIRIIGDYDADGINSTSILYLGFKWAGYKNVKYRIPKRFSEGFGINETIIDEIIDEIDEGLIITCDNGLAQTKAIKKAKDHGFEVIILDHHLPETDCGLVIDSPADIVIDPSAYPDTADFSGYCGAGLCYKFAEILLDYDKTKTTKLLTLAAVGTVADVMEIREENYVIVRNGLKYMKNFQTTVPGLYAILSLASENTKNKKDLLKYVTSTDIGFTIGPVINAASRMDDIGANYVIEILTYEGPYENILESVKNLYDVNNMRKELQTNAIETAKEVIEEKWDGKTAPLVLYLPGVHEGILGIIAGQIAESYRVPCFVLSDSEDPSKMKGSARSYGDYNVKENMDNVSRYLFVYGGHTGAGGLTVEKKNFENFKKAIQEVSKDFVVGEEEEIQYYDIEINASQIPDTIKKLDSLEPFGEGNPRPVFCIKNFEMIRKFGNYKQIMGKDMSTVKLFSKNADAIGIHLAEGFKFLDEPKTLDFLGDVEDNRYKDNVTHQVKFIDYQMH